MMKLKKIITNLIFVASLCCLMGCNKSRNGLSMVKIPWQNFEMSKTEVTQELYVSVMRENPSFFKGANNPVENVSWYDAIYFCNKLSVVKGYEPVYSVDGNTDITKWDYTPHQENSIEGEITQNTSANGYRLPTVEEWQYAAKGGQDYTYAGSNKINKVAWYDENSNHQSHPVAQKKANGYGLYDMSGNVEEWCWDSFYDSRYCCGGYWSGYDGSCEVSSSWNCYAYSASLSRGFRIIRSVILTSCGKSSNANVMIKIPGQNFEMSKTEVTQKLYVSVMRENPSFFKGANNPVENVSWYDAIYFCNKLSVAKGYEPVYSVDGNTDITKWDYTPHQENSIEGEITQNTSANGYRLPTVEEWQYAAKGGQDYTYAGSNKINKVAWYDENSNHQSHPVAQKKANGYGLYDMSGNVDEWCWDSFYYDRYCCGGSWLLTDNHCGFSVFEFCNANYQSDSIGFRIIRSVK